MNFSFDRNSTTKPKVCLFTEYQNKEDFSKTALLLFSEEQKNYHVKGLILVLSVGDSFKWKLYGLNNCLNDREQTKTVGD